MSEKRDIAGLWWFPSNPEEKWTGTLSLELDKSPKLTVAVPKSAFESFGQKLKAPPIIHGCDQNGNQITLLTPGWPRTHGGAALRETTYSAHYAVLGLELHCKKDFKTNKLSFRIQHLLNWVGVTGFSNAVASGDNGFGIHYELPKDQLFAISNDLSVKFCPVYSFNNGLHTKKAEENIWVTFVSENGINWSQMKELLAAFRSLLHFATLKRVYPLEMKADDVELWSSFIQEDVESEFMPNRWIFQFVDVRVRFSEFFSMWLKFVEGFEEAINCYHTTVYHSLPSEVEHLCLTQALEAYHGMKHASHEQRNFGGKIQELAATHKDHLKGLVDDVKEFGETVRDNRHYYTHHNPEDLKAGRIVKGAKLMRLNEKLKLLFQMCVLTEMGIPLERFSRLRTQLASDIIDLD